MVVSLGRKRLGAKDLGGVGISIRGVFDNETRRKRWRLRRTRSLLVQGVRAQNTVRGVDEAVAIFDNNPCETLPTLRLSLTC